MDSRNTESGHVESQEIQVQHISWDHFHGACIKIAESLQEHKFQPARILAIGRGGNIPATILSHLLGVTDLQSLRVETYNPETNAHTGKVTFHLPFKPADIALGAFGARDSDHPNFFQVLGAYGATWDHPHTLIVDDVYDSGMTMDHMKLAFPEATFCTIFHKGKRPAIGWPGEQLRKDIWYIFPWERKFS
jgi:hypoxanthine phosphoribosyltransferase